MSDSRPPQSKFLRQRSNSSVSRVDVGFFDPSGVQELRRTITQQQIEEGSRNSDLTLNVKDDEPFDFEKTLRLAVKR